MWIVQGLVKSVLQATRGHYITNPGLVLSESRRCKVLLPNLRKLILFPFIDLEILKLIECLSTRSPAALMEGGGNGQERSDAAARSQRSATSEHQEEEEQRQHDLQQPITFFLSVPPLISRFTRATSIGNAVM